MSKRKKKLNKCLLISFIIGLLYAIYAIFYWGSAMSSSGNGAEALGAGLATAVTLPHTVCAVLAVIFNGIGVFQIKPGFALTGAILYTVAMVLFIPYFIFVIVEMILSYIGFAQLNKQKKMEQRRRRRRRPVPVVEEEFDEDDE